MSEDYIYVLTRNDEINKNLAVLKLFINRVNAIEYLFKYCDKKKDDEDLYIMETDISYNDEEIFKMYEKSHGYVYNTKQLLYTYQIHKIENKYQDEL